MDNKVSNEEAITSSKSIGDKALKCLKALLWTVFVLVILVIAAIGCGVFYLNPERLTPLVIDYADRYIDGQVQASRIELSFWSSFPKVTLEVDDLIITSDALNHLPVEIISQLPSNADTVVCIHHFEGTLNIARLTAGTLKVHNVSIDRMRMNAIVVNDSIANYNIIKFHESDDTTTSFIDSIAISRFTITGSSPIRYVSICDSIDATISLKNLKIDGDTPGMYSLELDASSTCDAPPYLKLPEMPIGLNGDIGWSLKSPTAITLSDFNVAYGALEISTNAQVDFADSVIINSLSIAAHNLSVKDMIEMIPQENRGELSRLESNLSFDARMELSRPYVISDSHLPSFKANIRIPEGSLSYDRLSLNALRADIEVSYDAGNQAMSYVRINDLMAKGQSIGFQVSGTIDNPLGNALVDIRFRGGADFSKIPKSLARRLPYDLKGQLRGDTRFKFRLSDLTRNNFHRVKAHGQVKLTDASVSMQDSSLLAYVDHATLDFGTNTVIKTDTSSIDSLLTIRLNADSLYYTSDGITARIQELGLSLASLNTASAADTTKVIPLGGKIDFRRLTLSSDSDSMQLNLRNVTLKGRIQRYSDNERRPLLAMEGDIGNMRFRDALNRLTLRNSKVTFEIHPSTRVSYADRRRHIVDSLSILHPELPYDSLYAMSRNTRRRDSTGSVAASDNNIDFTVDRSIRRLLRQWFATGYVKARSGRYLSPYFPLSNTLRDLDIYFTSDSVSIRGASIRSGRSDAYITGHISNIVRAMSSRRQPVNLEFTVLSDTIDLNQITNSIMIGSAFAEKMRHTSVSSMDMGDNDDDDDESLITTHTDTTAKAAFVVPQNVNATIKLRASNVRYADIWFNRLRGNVEMADGRITLNRLAGYTTMGSMDITALYDAPRIDSINMAMGLVVRKLQVRKFLDLLPEIDSVLPLLREVNGIITAECAMTTQLDSMMDFKFHTLNLALKLSGDSLVLMDHETFNTVAKWLLFKDKRRDIIDHMDVELVIRDSHLDLYPFMFNIDRYKLGVSGWNDFGGKYDYHIAVLKSPLPFKFGVTIKDEGHGMKIRLGGAHFNENQIASSRQLTDTARINLVKEIEHVFRYGAKNDRRTRLSLKINENKAGEFNVSDTLTHADSLFFKNEGILPSPDSTISVQAQSTTQKRKSRSKRTR